MKTTNDVLLIMKGILIECSGILWNMDETATEEYGTDMNKEIMKKIEKWNKQW